MLESFRRLAGMLLGGCDSAKQNRECNPDAKCGNQPYSHRRKARQLSITKTFLPAIFLMNAW